MKKILIIMISMTLSLGVFAQRKGVIMSHRARVFTHIYVTPVYGYGFGYGYPFFDYPYFGYPYGYGLAPYAYRPMASYKLNAQINAIRSEYSYKIKAARKDKSVSSAQRKQDIFNLKSEREKAVANAVKNYNKRRMGMMNNQQGTNNNQNPTQDNSNSGTNNNQNS